MPVDVDHLRRQIDAASSFLHPAMARADALLLRVREVVARQRLPVTPTDRPPLDEVVLSLRDAQATALSHYSSARRLMEVLNHDQDAPEVLEVMTAQILATCSEMIRSARNVEVACDAIESRLRSDRPA